MGFLGIFGKPCTLGKVKVLRGSNFYLGLENGGFDLENKKMFSQTCASLTVGNS